MTKRVLLFGASKACENYLINNPNLNVIGILDNDKSKHNNLFQGYRVIAPEEAAQLEFDSIIITSMYVKKITAQLVDDLKVSKEKIEYPPKSMLKIITNPFQHRDTLALAEKLFLKLISHYKKNKITYFVEYGTLLGIVRGGEFIEWDDDIDFSIHPDSVETLLKIWPRLIKKVNEEIDFEVVYNYSYSKENEIIEIDLNIKGNDIKEFSVNIGLIRFEGTLAIQKMNAIDKKYYLKPGTINYKNTTISVPAPVEEYLTATYGDWKIVKKNTTFNDNTLTFFD